MADALFRFGSSRPTVTRRRGAHGRSPAIGRFSASVAALAILLAACGGGSAASPSVQAQATPSPSASPTAEATPTPAVTPTPEVTPTPAVTPTAAAAACQSQPPTALSQGWTQLTAHDGDYRFSYPSDWADLSGTVTIPTKDSVSPTTFAETGLASDAKINVDLVKLSDGSLGINAWELKGVRSATSALFDSELAWLKTQPQLKTVIDDRLQFCIDGALARGFSSTWTGVSTNDKFVVIYLLQRNGKMYEVQMSADDPAGAATLQELLQTWKWSEPLAGTPNNIDSELAATKFMAIGTSSTLDQSGDHPNAATFSSTFPTTVDRIYAIYELDNGVHETVLFSWKRNGTEVAKATFDYSDKTSYAWTWMNGPFKVGDYEVTATLKTSGDKITVSFKVQ